MQTVVWSNGQVEITVKVQSSLDDFSALCEKLDQARALGIVIHVDDFHVITRY